MFKIKIGSIKIKYYSSEKQFNIWWNKHIQKYGDCYDIIAEELQNGVYKQIKIRRKK